MTSYSQYGEDIKIRQLLGSAVGRLLDIGAYDPKAMSNSRALIESGWDAVLIEPSPLPLRNLVMEYAGNEKVTIIGAAVSDSLGLKAFDLTDDAVSTCDSETHQKWSGQAHYYGQAWIPTITIRGVADHFGTDFQFVSIDAEGNSKDIALAMLRGTQIRPRVACVEHDGHVGLLTAAFKEFGYRAVTDNGTNLIFSQK